MSYRTKRSAPMSQMGYNKSRVINGKVLKYRATAPVPGSFRSRQAAVGELKNVDFSDQTALTTAGTATLVGLINGMATGPATNERIGRRVTMKSLWVRWNFTMQAASAGASPFRILIVYDKQPNGGAQPAATSVVVTNDINGLKNLSNERRFTTLMDEYIQPIGTGGPQSVIGQRFIKLNHEVEFSGAGGGVGDISTGAVWVYIWQNGSITTTGPASNFQTRVRYCD